MSFTCGEAKCASVPNGFSAKTTGSVFSLSGCHIENGSSLGILGMRLHKGTKYLLLATPAVGL